MVARQKQIAPVVGTGASLGLDFRIGSMTSAPAARNSNSEPPNSMPRLFALVPAAGVGQRAGASGPKQYESLAGQCVVARSLSALARVARLHAALVVLAPDDAQVERHVDAIDAARLWVARCGGATRAQTVANGLDELARRGAAADDWVLVHDAARCLVEPAWVDRLIDECVADAVGGLLALPLADTLKQAIDGRSAATVDRSGKWGAQMPQMFRLQMLRDALARAGTGATDEASAIEQLGHRPKLVRGHVRNIKITWPEDFDIARALLAQQERSVKT
jgi:2-C-methyl-D-erythritol 4-phosphate cytidylyltransferase